MSVYIALACIVGVIITLYTVGMIFGPVWVRHIVKNHQKHKES